MKGFRLKAHALLQLKEQFYFLFFNWKVFAKTTDNAPQ